MIRLSKIGYLTAQEAAEWLGMPRLSFYKLRDKGALPEPIIDHARMSVWKVSQIKAVAKTLGIKINKR